MEKGYVVTTAHQGVFYGYNNDPGDGPIVTLRRARMCVYWPAETHGVLGLATTGPSSGARITPAVPSLVLWDVTAIVLCSDDAIAAWETEPWG